MRSVRTRPAPRRNISVIITIAAVIVVAGIGWVNAFAQATLATPRPAASSRAIAPQPSATAQSFAVAGLTSLPPDTSAAPTTEPTPEMASTPAPENTASPEPSTPEPSPSPLASSSATPGASITPGATPSAPPSLSPTSLPPSATAVPPTATPDAPSPTPIPTTRPLIGEHVVEAGDTVYGIAARYGVDPERLMVANRLGPDATIRVGQTLLIPRASGVVHTVAAGETLATLARTYGVNAAAIAEANGLTDPESLPVGRRLIIPGASAPVPSATVVPTRVPPSATPTRVPPTATVTTVAQVADLAGPPRSAGGRGGATMAWPARGGISTRFGDEGHTGIDIMTAMGDAVVAAGNGVVVVALRSDYGYGWRIEVDHGGGLTTVYAHLSSFNVTQGDRVNRGQLIGLAGSTGFSTGPHLHFEVRQAGVVVDPMPYLP